MRGLNKIITRTLIVVGLLGLTVSGIVLMEGCIPQVLDSQISRCREQGLTAQESLGLIENNENDAEFIIIDLRLPQDFEKEHIAGATNIDFSSETFRDEIDNLDRNNTYLIYSYCSCGGVGWNAQRIMEELGFRKVCNMWTGIQEWREKELPTIKESPL